MNKQQLENIRYKLMIQKSGMSKRHIVTEYKTNNKDIAIILRDKKFKDDGSVFIWSNNTGNGKTTAGTAILKAYAKDLSKGDVIPETPIYFIGLSEFFNELRRDIGRTDKRTPEIIHRAKTSDITMFDDLTVVDKLTDFEKDNLYEIVDCRVREMKANIFTSNQNPKTLERMIGKPLYSKIVTASKIVEFTGEDKR